MSDAVWVAVLGEDPPAPAYPWQPALEQGGDCIGLEVWFIDEVACLSWIRDVIVGAGLWESVGADLGDEGDLCYP